MPTVLLAAAATIIASQAVISGAFPMTRQAGQLGLLPRVLVVHKRIIETWRLRRLDQHLLSRRYDSADMHF
ncbi:KUP/HAK/KT family potassium transporter [Paraburkholderia sediminicola]|uniref:KUP/HAK/KT family potassium transporter n=1 Tax=Paraburkholderia sediminicola TaxID=458836 RepID=UPI0038BC8A2D